MAVCKGKELRGNRRMGGEDFTCISCYGRRLGMTEAGGADDGCLGASREDAHQRRSNVYVNNMLTTGG